MTTLRSFTAIFSGFRLCLFDPKIRALAVRPWLIGTLAYFGTIYCAIRAHTPLLALLVEHHHALGSTLMYPLLWLMVTGGLIFASTIISIGLVFIFAGLFQVAIAKAVLARSGTEPPEVSRGVPAEAGGSLLSEIQKFVFLFPLMILTLLLGLIPFLTPLAVIFGSWLLAYQFVDVTLEVFGLSVRERLRFARKNFGQMVFFGLTLTILWAVPLLGLVLPPVACAAAAWLLSSESLLKQISS